MGTGICHYCGKSAGNGELFTVQQRDGTREQRFAHVACMAKSGERLITSRNLNDATNASRSPHG
jgi:hypothetical protein